MERAENPIKSRRVKLSISMQKLHLILLAGILMASCTSNQKGLSKEDIQGTYDADFSSYLKQMLNDDEEIKEDPLALAFAEILISDMKMTMTFEQDSLFTETRGGVVDFAQAFSNNDEEIKKAYLYEIRNDSLLYTKEEDKEFEEFGILRRANNTCDSLIILMREDDGKLSQIPIVRKK